MDIYTGIAISLIFLLPLIWLCWKNPLYLLASHILSRVILDSFPSVIYIELLSGISIMEVYTGFFIALILIYLFFKTKKKVFILKMSIISILLAFACSAIVSSNWSGMIGISSKWVYLFVMVGLVVYCLEKNSINKVMFVIWVCLLYPQANQLYHYFVSPPKMDGTIASYVGSYDHESSLGFLLLAALLANTILLFNLRNKLYKVFYLFAIVYVSWAVYVNNYRTITASIGLYWIVVFLLSYSRLNINMKIVTPFISSLLTIFLVVVLSDKIIDMFGDVGVLLTDPSAYFDFSGKAKSNNLFSGRIDIINGFMGVWVNSSFENIIFGLGPGVIETIIGVYAHNEYLSALGEMGIVGFIVIITFVINLVYQNLKVSIKYKSMTIYPCAMIICIVLIGFLTMPFRNIRAMLLLAICLGVIESIRRTNLKILNTTSVLRDGNGRS